MTEVLRSLVPLILYVAVFAVAFAVWSRFKTARRDFTSLKTVTFGDESAVRASRAASVVSIVTLFFLWATFTGSVLLPGVLHMPGPFQGAGTFTYTASDGTRSDDATVQVFVHPAGEEPEVAVVDGGDGFAKDDVVLVQMQRNQLARVDRNDELGRDEGVEITAIDGTPVRAGDSVDVGFATVTISQRGTPNVVPDAGWQMEAIWLPPPEDVVARLGQIATEGFRNSTLAEHLGYSLFRVLVGFVFGALVGIPLGYAMGLSDWFRGWFDPIVEFMRPVPPLALIPLVIIWAGIGERGKIVLLFLAALWIMAIAARAGVSGVKISKVHAAYSLGASRWQVLRHVIVPNSLPEIFTGARVAMGVCWGTVVAAELVAAEQGAGMMIMTASKFQNTDIVILGIVLIGIIGFGIDVLMRYAEAALVPWKGKA
ncbi:MAG: ABC transporter permease [Paracoccaceae bacterium]